MNSSVIGLGWISIFQVKLYFRVANALNYITETLGKKQKRNGEKKEEQFALVVPQTIGCEELDHIVCSDSYTCKFELRATTDPLLIYHSS